MEVSFAAQQKILAFQFLSVAVRFAEVGRATSSAPTREQCVRQMREAYDAALLLSVRLSFTVGDCGAFDAGSAYVEESFVLLRQRTRGLHEHTGGADPAASLQEWEPMWGDPRPDAAWTGAMVAASAVRRHLKEIEDAAYAQNAA